MRVVEARITILRIAVRFGLLFILAGVPITAGAATLVYPHALFMDDDHRSTVFYVQNTGAVPAEMEVDLRFGYPASDSFGGVHIELVDDPEPQAPTATGWVRALPRRMVIHPGQRQAIRLLAQPPENLPDGEYWSRVIVTSREVRPTLSPEVDAEIRVGLRLETRTLISMSYRRANVRTGARIRQYEAQVSGESLEVAVEIEREGNAAYLGQLALTLTDATERRLARWERVVAVYYDLFRRFTYALPHLEPGGYRLHLELATVRQDIPAADVIQAEPVRAVTELTIP